MSFTNVLIYLSSTAGRLLAPPGTFVANGSYRDVMAAFAVEGSRHGILPRGRVQGQVSLPIHFPEPLTYASSAQQVRALISWQDLYQLVKKENPVIRRQLL